MNNQTKKELILTGVFFKDKSDGRVGSFFLEIPGVVAQGETKEEAEDNLFKVLPMMLEDIAEENKVQSLIDGDSNFLESKSYHFQTA